MDEKMENIAFKMRSDAKEEARVKLENVNLSLSRLAQAALYRGLFMSDDELRDFVLGGEEREVEFAHRKLEIQMQFSEITLARKKIDIYGKGAIERAIREGHLPDTCSRGVLLINRALALAFKKTDAGEWKSNDLSNFFVKLKSSLPEMGNLLTVDVHSIEHAEGIYKLWKQLGFVEKDIISYFLDFKAIELLK